LDTFANLDGNRFDNVIFGRNSLHDSLYLVIALVILIVGDSIVSIVVMNIFGYI